jgi:DNA-binding NtrC family response regulator
MAQTTRVLIVDADEQTRVLLHKALLGRALSSNTAASAGEALALLREWHGEIVLLHFEISGAQSVLDSIRSMFPEHRPIVMVTAEVRSPKEAIDTDLVQVIMRRPLHVVEVAEIIGSCLEFLPRIRE